MTGKVLAMMAPPNMKAPNFIPSQRLRNWLMPPFYPPAHEKAQRHGLGGFGAGAEEMGMGRLILTLGSFLL